MNVCRRERERQRKTKVRKCKGIWKFTACRRFLYLLHFVMLPTHDFYVCWLVAFNQHFGIVSILFLCLMFFFLFLFFFQPFAVGAAVVHSFVSHLSLLGLACARERFDSVWEWERVNEWVCSCFVLMLTFVTLYAGTSTTFINTLTARTNPKYKINFMLFTSI